jgi:5-(carboxyamino)imidazole ribonucleotide mutase
MRRPLEGDTGDSMPQPLVGLVLGSSSDEEKAKAAWVLLEKFDVDYELTIMSAHRSPQRVAEYALSAEDRGLKVLIAAAGRSAALPGVIAAHTILPVVGLPIWSTHVGGLDSLLSIVQMPSGVPVATVGLDAGANAGILAIQLLALGDARLREQLREFKQQLNEGLRL